MNRFFRPMGWFVLALAISGCAKEPASNFKVENAAPVVVNAAGDAVGVVEDTGFAESAGDDAAAPPAATAGKKPTAAKAEYEPSQQGPVVENGVFRPFPIYTDDSSPDNHYFPSGWMGDYSDVTFESAYPQDSHSGSTCIQVKYSNKASQGARWTGIYWQNPANNWGNRPGGYDLTGAAKLSFWARGEKGGERIEEFKMGGLTGEYSDSDLAGIGPVTLTQEWKQYAIDLEGKDLSAVTGGFAWAANIDNNPDGVIFYLDDIRYE